MAKLKHIGIAAITAEGAALAYRLICQESQKIFGKNKHPEITLHSFSFSEYLSDPQNRLEIAGKLLLASSKKLAASGAEFFICPANTTHEVYDLLKNKLPIPWLHIADAVLAEVQNKNLKNVALLGTIYTMCGEIYSNKFTQAGITISVPNAEQQREIQNIIYQELLLGEFLDQSKQYLINVIESMEQAGCEGVILGCTELPLIISKKDVNLALFDSTHILAKTAVNYASKN